MTDTSKPIPPAEALARFNEIFETLRARRGRPALLQSAFCAATLMPTEDAQGAVEAMAAERDAINDAISGFRAPSGSLRWVYAAILSSRNASARTLVSTIHALKAARKARRGHGLYAGGARAALVLTACGQTDSMTIRRFLELKDGLTPPWWRRNSAITDTFAAGHAVAGDSLHDVQARRARVEETLRSDRQAKRHARDGARTAVLLGHDGDAVLERFHALEQGRRADRYVRSRSNQSMAMDWAALGFTLDDGAAMSEIAHGLPRGVGSTGYARMRLAQLIVAAGKPELAQANVASAAAAVSAVIAAQTAVIVAATTATTAATTSAAT